MKRTILLLLALAVVAWANPVATITNDPQNPIAPATTTDLDELYALLAPRITAQVTAEIDGKITAAKQQVWQQFTAADAANARMLETAMLQRMKAAFDAVVDARLTELSQ